ncbi:endonuclease/exonuclease/phosphatase family protein [Methylobacterium sp. WL120]|uniref:endonuclease/exonuclease/phosphatase family protein n=1 Tax=Methylobacterium sp. WL120 TaxID=2603887 RepID=UPI0011CA1CFC|nr:endonuclease/exonuclease/phosphatase family protein [Methylobacterium sp. WL120]TXM70722.1 endonuclease/exonuclease/phosphatase family protein [Methylobacterium sp. WL120]
MRSVIWYALVILALALSAASLIPLIETEWWWVRLLDFPRLPFAAGLLAVGLGLLFFLRTSPKSTASTLVLVVVALAVDGWILRPYLPTGGLRVDTCPVERRLSVMIANVQLGNRNAQPLVEAVSREEPDLFLAMETDAWWDRALKPVLETMPHVLQRITGSYYGIHLFSRLPLVNGEIRHLAGQDTPAIVTGVALRTGEVVDFVGMHPKPPQLWQSALGRDAQLYAAAAVLRERVEPGVLAGDLNATPWEIAVERMARLSGLIDPRRGYGYVATWNAHSSWLRWPLDHVFHEGGFATMSVERLDAFGSDHFPYLVRLCRQAEERSTPFPRQREAENVGAANAVLSAAGASERLQPR